ncbi:MAG: aminodeoxychorismate synthase component I [Gammaproteobacteria bacterium]|nr:aminodeoxychorismate synthase component I [Gammaproteobacteria bacterium]MBU1980641.1 aminodeoxychorismate synthase component I [Gammaproteobacteria bacterium]
MPVIQLPGTPDLLGLHAANPLRYPYLLQTLSCPGWDILFAFPVQSQIFPSDPAGLGKSFFSVLDEEWGKAARSPDQRETRLPFHGGWFIYLGYELLHQLEPSVAERQQTSQFPLAALIRIPAAIMVDHAEGQTYLFAEEAHSHLLEDLHTDLSDVAEYAGSPVRVEEVEEEDEQIFLQGVAKIKHYILEGDVFQVNLARQWRARIEHQDSAAGVYARLRESNPAPFAGIADFGSHQIISSSPERLAKVRGGVIETRPIAGTHPRAPLAEEDELLRQQLIASPKERAEHIMLVDLERNDLGRVCEPGSIEVCELMTVCSYAHVHHIESSVHGRLRENTTPSEVMRALFPGGTITGCPKVRTMQIISELEPSSRYAYTGSMGYLNHDGSMDLNILIRTFMLEESALTFKAGAGIVADSDPLRELAETRAKAKGLLRAIGAAQ